MPAEFQTPSTPDWRWYASTYDRLSSALRVTHTRAAFSMNTLQAWKTAHKQFTPARRAHSFIKAMDAMRHGEG
jgi:DNA-binding transcriptional regulator GbsR (MarR family)